VTRPDEAIRRLAGGVAHDFNNLLTSITALSALALQELPEDHPTRPDIEEIERAGQRAVALTRQLLAIAGRGPSRPAPLDVNRALAALEPALRALLDGRASLAVHSGGEVPGVAIDARSFEQLLTNLVANARDSAGPGGAVVIECATDPTRRQYAVVRVRDTGPPEHPDDLARLLEPFWTPHSGRKLGLGLAAADALARQAGGWIEVHAAEGQSPVFEVRLPATEAARPEGT
jgi:signal transduction histidine kinase